MTVSGKAQIVVVQRDVVIVYVVVIVYTVVVVISGLFVDVVVVDSKPGAEFIGG